MIQISRNFGRAGCDSGAGGQRKGNRCAACSTAHLSALVRAPKERIAWHAAHVLDDEAWPAKTRATSRADRLRDIFPRILRGRDSLRRSQTLHGTNV